MSELPTKEKPILFNPEMIKAILNGTKCMTRRILKPQPPHHDWNIVRASHHNFLGPNSQWMKCPYGTAGKQLWVRETYAAEEKWDDLAPSEIKEACINDFQDPSRIWYKASEDWERWDLHEPRGKVRQSIFMCRWMSRIQLEILEIRVERLQDITTEDAKAEGCNLNWYRDNAGTEDLWPCPTCNGMQVRACLGNNLGVDETDCYECNTAKKMFQHLWDSINGKDYPWEMNPWVFVISFKRLT